jgi:hypothetical protein
MVEWVDWRHHQEWSREEGTGRFRYIGLTSLPPVPVEIHVSGDANA